ncbi:hypothetical protein BHE75_01049 [Sphingomonas haloaromaticamans]|uniref:Uncharacterized protein n=2 Tax=Edaphosphingomonas haloaromaticamans TaxID=653954 RepID=A0A1S1HAB1_9SPHN|nr:hypothetical protein BHE75_01049 [Sphingomonas haloaromaticamans]
MRTYSEHLSRLAGRKMEMAMHLLSTIERHLRRNRVPPTRFGREAVNDPRFVLDLRRGREPRAATRDRVLAYIAMHREQAGA